MHLKRQKVPKNWPITRKATKYVVRPNSDINGGLPILIILRNILKIAQNRREVKKAIHQGNILLNKRKVKDEKNVAKLFDVITLVPSKKNYKMILSNKGKFKFEEVKENESNTKIVEKDGKSFRLTTFETSVSTDASGLMSTVHIGLTGSDGTLYPGSSVAHDGMRVPPDEWVTVVWNFLKPV